MDLDNFQSRNEFLSIACIIINTRILHSCSGKSVDSSPTNFSKYFLLQWNCVIKFYPRSEDYLVAVSARKKRERKKKLLKECQNAAVPRIIPFSHFSTFNLSKSVNFARCDNDGSLIGRLGEKTSWIRNFRKHRCDKHDNIRPMPSNSHSN